MYKDTDLAWAAGLLEGEGCFTIHTKKHPYILIDMTDKDVIERLHAIFPFGNMRGPYKHKKRDHCKDRWRFDAFGPKARHIILHVFPYMGERRKKRMSELMEL